MPPRPMVASPLAPGLASRAGQLRFALPFKRPLEEGDGRGRGLTAAALRLGRLLGHELRPGDSIDHAVHAIDTSRAQLTVVDIHNLHDRAQRFVVGVVLKRELAHKEGTGTSSPLMFVVLDELNKYAPREGHSPIKEVLLDIAERGRPLGVVLIGAQQTASEVAPRIVANCSIRVAGRVDAAEAKRGEYGFLTPAWATRRSEVGGDEDPFARFEGGS